MTLSNIICFNIILVPFNSFYFFCDYFIIPQPVMLYLSAMPSFGKILSFVVTRTGRAKLGKGRPKTGFWMARFLSLKDREVVLKN